MSSLLPRSVRTSSAFLATRRRPGQLLQWLPPATFLRRHILPSRLLSMDGAQSSAISNPERKRPSTDEVEVEIPVEKKQKIAEESGEDAAQNREIPVAGPSTNTSRKRKSQSRGDARKARAEENKLGKRRGTRTDVPEGEKAQHDGEPKGPRLPKRQCALLIGFCGSAYNGMQIQVDVPTIEGTLFEALTKAGAVSDDNADDAKKVNFNRAARTDAGVHAAGNVVSMKMIMKVPDVPDLTARINEYLPPDIRLWGFVRVQNSFNARSSCDSRKYTYFFPSYMLVPPKPATGLYKSAIENSETPSSLLDFWKDIPLDSAPADDLARKRRWRAPKEAVEALRTTAKRYEGSHKFHNFTVGYEFSESQSMRYMKGIEICDPIIYGDTEWISVVLHGQSFMLHQRKMMTALILTCRTGTPATVIDELYGPRRAFIPKMPALGLLLEYPIFDTYNKRLGAASAKKPDDPEYRPEIDFEVYRDKIEQFKQEHIYPKMRDVEDQCGIFDAWIRSIDVYPGSDLLWLNPKGVLPDAAVFQKGTPRIQPFREKKRFDTTSFTQSRIESMGVEEEEEAEEEVVVDKKALAEMED